MSQPDRKGIVEGKVLKSVLAAFVLLSTIAIPMFANLSTSLTPTISGFVVNILTSGLDKPKGIISALYQAKAEKFGNNLYVAESGASHIVKVDQNGGGSFLFAKTNPDTFPVGVAFMGDGFGSYLYVGNAIDGGIVKIDSSGTVSTFALDGMRIAEMDFGQGEYGPYMYAGEWPNGKIWKIDPDGKAELFSSTPGTQTRYLKFSNENGFGTFLYYTDWKNGDIYRVDPKGKASKFASIGSPQLEGFDFGPGGAFGYYLYAGDIITGQIFRVDPDGKWVEWASGFNGVADIHFEPNKEGSFIMNIVDGKGDINKDDKLDGTVYAIHPEEISVHVDVKPGSCLNPLNLKSKGVLPVAVLGTEDFDVTVIDPATVEISLEEIEEGVSPLRWSYEDVATSLEEESCGCHDLDGDGFLDLMFHFKKEEVIETLLLNELKVETVSLAIDGNLYDDYGGTPIVGQDRIWILKHKGKN